MVAFILLLQALFPVKGNSESSKVDDQQSYFEFDNKFLTDILKIAFTHALETFSNVLFD